MKKIICVLMVAILVFSSISFAFAECDHTGEKYYKYRYTAWQHLNKDQSEEYDSTHYRSVYVRVYCQDCDVMLYEVFEGVEWADHTLPCSLCHAT